MTNKIATCLDTAKFSKKPDGKDVAIISKTLAENSVQVTFDQFVKAIGEGRTYALATGFKDNSRKARNFKGIQIFAADIDDHNYDYETIKELADKFDIEANIIHESFSSCPGHHKWRVIFIAERPITEPKIALGILKKIRDYFNSDRAIVDLSRMLYGTTQDKIHYVSNKLFNAYAVKLPEPVICDKTQSLSAAKLPDKTKYTAKTIQTIKQVKCDFYFGRSARYLSIWHGARKLAATNHMTVDAIHSQINRWIENNPRFDDYDRSETEIAQLINNAIEWMCNLDD